MASKMLKSAFFVLSSIIMAQGMPYDGYDITALIPWIGGHGNFNDAPHANIRIAALDGSWTGAAGSFLVDTGTCGIVTTAAKTNIKPEEKIDANRGWEYLSSSHILYTGWWVERYVSFTDATNASTSVEVRAKVKILSIDIKWVDCDSWTTADRDTCPGGTTDPNPITTMMGIGYGRTYDGMPQGTPDKNVLLNLINIGASDLSTGFYPGWRIDEQGIRVGLTNSVWDRMTDFELQLDSDPTIPPPSISTAGPRPHYAWKEVRMCIAFPTISSTCYNVQLLLDTGIDNASIRLPKADAKSIRVSDAVKELKDSTPAEIRAGGIMRLFGRFQYNPTSPDISCDITPQVAKVTYDSAKSDFVNTGRHFFRKWAQGYDPWRGKIGFQEHGLLVACS